MSTASIVEHWMRRDIEIPINDNHENDFESFRVFLTCFASSKKLKDR